MLIDRLVTSTLFTVLGGWLMTDEDAHITEELRGKMSTRVVQASDRAINREFDTGHGTTEVWFWRKMLQRLGCRICMGLEWSVLAWWATSDRRSRSGLLRMLVEIGAINGAHVIIAKLTAPKETH